MLSPGVTNATVGATLHFPFHTRQLFTQCLQQPRLTSTSSLLLSSPISLFPLHFFFFLPSVTLSAVSPVMEWLSSPVHRARQVCVCVCGECLVLPIIVPVTAVSSALTALHIQGGQIHINTLRSLCDRSARTPAARQHTQTRRKQMIQDLDK